MKIMGRTKLRADYGVSGSSEDMLDRAIDALSVLKISNSYLQSNLDETKADQKTLAAFSMIKKSVTKIEAFLDSAKHEQKFSSKNNQVHLPQNFKKRWFPLSELLQMVKPRSIPSTVQVNFPKNDFQIFGNFYKLVVLISNLVENSIEAMKNNGVINISAKEGNDFVLIEVKDSGPGFPQESIKKAFSSLFTTKPDGNGLGLKVAKTIVDMHGGTISIRNNPTTFSIKLPKS